MPKGLNMEKVQEALKTFYLPGLQYQLNEKEGAFYAQIEKSSKEVVGKDILMALRYGKNGGVGNRADDGLLPEPSSRSTKQARWETKNVFARIAMSDKVMKASRNDRGAFANLLETELEDAQTDAKDNFARQLFGDGKGVMAVVSTTAGAGNDIAVNDTKFFGEGQRIDILESDGETAVAESRIIDIVDHDNLTIRISGTAVAVTEDDIIVTSGNYGSELTGLGNIFTLDSTLYGIDRTEHKWLNPNVINVDGLISELDIQEGVDKSEIYAGSDINFMLTSYGVRRAYQKMMLEYKNHVNTLELKGGWKALDYNGIPLVADKYCDAGTIFQLDKENWKLYQMGDWDWLDKDGSIFSRVTDRPIYEATLVKYADLGCNKPKAQVKLINITEA